LPPETADWKLKIIKEISAYDDFRYGFRQVAIAVRTDAQPFWWIVVKARLEKEERMRELRRDIFSAFWKAGLLGTPEYEEPRFSHIRWRDEFFFNLLLAAWFLALDIWSFDILTTFFIGWWGYLGWNRLGQLTRSHQIYELRVVNQVNIPRVIAEDFVEGRINFQTVVDWVERARQIEQQKRHEYQEWDRNCRFYSFDGFLHCAVNPVGGCSNCPHFEGK
jgi:hypothetical protein